MKVRIGIDVGGTFTDAVAIDNETFEVVGSVKVPTTHTAAEGVAAGIVQVLHKVMEQCEIRPEDVIFIAHGTTQATNALLEGDVAPVGIITLGSGLQGAKSKGDTTMGDIELSEGKYLRSCNEYVDTNTPDLDGSIRAAIQKLQEQGHRPLLPPRPSAWTTRRTRTGWSRSAVKWACLPQRPTRSPSCTA